MLLAGLASLCALHASIAATGDSWRAGASTVTPGHPAQAALDPPAARRSWLAAAAAPQWLVVDFGRPMRLRSITQRFPTQADWRFVIEGSDSGATAQPDQWTGLAASPPDAARRSVYALTLSGTYRYVRLTVLSGGVPGSTGLAIEGDTVATPPPPLSPSMAGPAIGPDDPLPVMQSCDLWSSAAIWRSVLSRQPGNRPLVGAYDDAYASVADARIALALRAGVTAFQSCWFREHGNAGQPVMTEYEGFIRALADQAGLRDRVRWSLFWDNTNPAGDGVSGVDDFLTHLVPFWIDAYLSRTNYLSIGGRKLLAIGDAHAFATQTGGIGQARIALAGLRARARQAGLGELIVLTCNNGDSHASNDTAHRIGFDGVMAYATPIFTGLLQGTAPSDGEVMRAERQSWSDWLAASAIPPVLTVSVGYDMRIWSTAQVHYRLTPTDFAALLRDALRKARSLPLRSLGRQLVYLDNWNEFGEGHFIEPTVASGDATLRAVASVLRPGIVPAFPTMPATLPGFAVP